MATVHGEINLYDSFRASNETLHGNGHINGVKILHSKNYQAFSHTCKIFRALIRLVLAKASASVMPAPASRLSL